MRQPTDDFRINPFDEYESEAIASPNMTPVLIAHQKHYTLNRLMLQSHTYCSKHCFDLSSSKVNDAENNCLKSCVSSYSSAMNMLLSQ